jgi:hypothetical protein
MGLVLRLPQLRQTKVQGGTEDHRFPKVEQSRILRIVAGALGTNLAIAVFALLDARAMQH